MRALRFDGPGEVRLVDVPVPALAGDEVLIKTTYAAVCGTDAHMLEGGFPARRGIVMGHEAAGVVAALGERVRHLELGQRVVTSPIIVCGQCLACRSGRYNVCQRRLHLGIEADGVFAEYYKLPGYSVFPAPKELDPKEAALVEPAAVGYHAVCRAAPTPSETVVVMGAGPIGLFLLESVAAFGCQKIIVSGHRRRRLDVAKQLGAHRVVQTPDEDLRAVVMQETDGAGADLVIEAVGRPETVSESVHLARSAGRIMMVGIPGKPVAFDFLHLVRREVDLLTSDASLFAVERIHELVAKRILDARPLITHTFPFRDVVEAIRASKGTDAIKVLVEFDA
ncbi:MAG: alcohol dehydrogenase catalytic domain-containing protein [Candidatus Bipolaricaulota bacterium]